MSESNVNLKGGVEEVTPYRDKETEHKGAQVEEMFDSIAPAYDFMNTAMTFGLHRRWRDKALKAALDTLPAGAPLKILDVATGTGDVAFRIHDLLPEAKITGIDLSTGMLDVARKKLRDLPEADQQKFAFGKADCLALPFHDGEFSLITVAYGVRNFENLLQGLKEMRRVLKNGGTLCVIELSSPEGKITGLGYRIYSRKLIPWVGKMVSGDSRAYSYLPESIAACPQREEMAKLMKKAGFTSVKWKSLTFGAVTYYLATI
ncbi:MAG: bifunctional demethylmenaquinone methyltransferase/2-methoxy-6-polyprenyl-1,4-benzoquinol methylase UbiE [Bacteroides sp.]|nr:bifunctional demethylmenaquinone methyltransferase/2-methoxy-6-polyprenyl-1,4-benzoquinol methylase UbiE [Bacteroides sp.]